MCWDTTDSVVQLMNWLDWGRGAGARGAGADLVDDTATAVL